MYASGGNPRIAYSITLNPLSLPNKSRHTHTQGYPSWPAGASRPLRELKATEDKQERGREGGGEGGGGEAECTVASMGKEKVEYIIKRLAAVVSSCLRK